MHNTTNDSTSTAAELASILTAMHPELRDSFERHFAPQLRDIQRSELLAELIVEARLWSVEGVCSRHAERLGRDDDYPELPAFFYAWISVDCANTDEDNLATFDVGIHERDDEWEHGDKCRQRAALDMLVNEVCDAVSGDLDWYWEDPEWSAALTAQEDPDLFEAAVHELRHTWPNLTATGDIFGAAETPNDDGDDPAGEADTVTTPTTVELEAPTVVSPEGRSQLGIRCAECPLAKFATGNATEAVTR